MFCALLVFQDTCNIQYTYIVLGIVSIHYNNSVRYIVSVQYTKKQQQCNIKLLSIKLKA
jgi:hypothetical protein